MKKTYKLAALYTLSHFLVDFTTVFLISAIILGPPIGFADRGSIIIAYNLIAFAGQLPIGMLADIIRKNRLFVSIGCLLAALSFPLVLIFPVGACILAALGNGFFHIGAGTDILEMSAPKAGLSGLFVSSGALGVWLAYKASSMIFMLLCPLAMLISVISINLLEKNYSTENPPGKISFRKPAFLVFAATGCFVLTIVIRSLLGMIMNFPWKSIPSLSFFATIAVVSGKALGGFLGDKTGHMKTAAFSLGVSLIAFIFSFDSPTFGILAIMCFNMTMPLTLTAIANVSRRKYGFSFGLTTFALALGFIPTVLGAEKFFTLPFLTAMVALSLILLMSGYIFLRIHSRRER